MDSISRDKSVHNFIVQDITGIPCSILYGRIDDVPRRIFGRRIDLDRFRNFLRGVHRLKSQKTDFWPNNGLFLAVFRSPRLQNSPKP